MKGRLQVIAAGESDERLVKARRSLWTQISPASQASFTAPSMPGTEISREDGEGEDEGDVKDAGEINPPKEPSSEFCLVLLWPHYVDHLVLGAGQTRHVHRLVGDRDGGGALLVGTDEGGRSEQEGSPEVGVKPVVWTTVEVHP